MSPHFLDFIKSSLLEAGNSINSRFNTSFDFNHYLNFIFRDHLYVLPMILVILILGLWLLFKTRSEIGMRKLKVKLVEKEVLTHDTAVFTFGLPDGLNRLGLKIGEHLQVEYVLINYIS